MENYKIYKIPNHELDLIGKENSIYGSPTDGGLNKIIQELKNLNNITGIDLGCGDGYIVNYLNTNLDIEMQGIELSSYRLDLSNYLENNYLIEGDLLSISYRDYNFIYCNNVCFTDLLQEQLEEKILREFNGYILFFKRISNIKLLSNCSLLKKFSIETSWIKSHEVYLYYKY